MEKPETITEKKEKPKYKRPEEEENEVLVRIYGFDISGSKSIFVGLTKIKGISWAVSNAICKKLNLEKRKKVSELSKSEINHIETFLKKMEIPEFLINRRLDQTTGETKHYLSSDLDVKKEFDIKRLKEIKSYRGSRHSQKLPSRGQRTRSHFRKKGQAMGVKKKVK
jgi:small subunit ribosomal protein S13